MAKITTIPRGTMVVVQKPKSISSDFDKKYAKEIEGIAKANNKDLSTASAMFKANLDNAGKGVEAYKGGGVATNWDEMVSDYKQLKQKATDEVKNSKKTVKNAYGKDINVSDLLPSGSGYGTTTGSGVSGGVIDTSNLFGGIANNQLSQMGGSGQTSGSSGGNGGINIADFFKGNADAYVDAQKAIFDKQLSQQLTDLESSYAQAISEGKISVRDAEAAFTKQKAQIEQEAYKQAESTKAYSNEMGISNSQQAVGMQQGDNARVRSVNNANATDREKRIADIMDRISTLGLQKNLATTQATADYGYNMAGANAQASQMYNQSMGNFMQEDYFSDKTQSNAERNMAIQQGYNKENAAINQGYTKENREADFQNTLKQMQEGNRLDINKMYVGQELDIEKIGIQFGNELKAMAVQNGYSTALENTRAANNLKSIAASASANAKAEVDAYTVSRQREAVRLGIDPSSNEYAIDQAQKSEARKLYDEETKRNVQEIITSSNAQAYTQWKNDSVFSNPDLMLNPTNPNKTDYTDRSAIGGLNPVNYLLNLATGYNKGDEAAYQDEVARNKAAQEAVQRRLLELQGNY